MQIEGSYVSEIKQKFSQVENKLDLLALLNSASEIIYGKDSKPFTINQLNYYADPRKSSKRYETYIIKKKSGGERQINSPIKGLKALLKSLNLILQSIAEPHRLAFGFVLNKSIVDNAKIHLNKNYVYNIDLKDFFHSFDRKKVKTVFLQEPFNLKDDKEPLAFLLASLCTHPLLIDDKTKIILPQGSPTSPTLTNIICIRLDRRLNGLAKKMRIKYSRYADDITFSSDRNVFKDTEFQKELKRIIEEDQNLVINPKKTRLQNALHRQEVTGLTVNEKVNVQKRYLKQIRMWIYYWERYGYIRAQHLFANDYLKDKGHILKGNPNLGNVLSGKLDFLKMVKGENNSTYASLENRFNKLKEKTNTVYKIIDLWNKKGINHAMEKFYGVEHVEKEVKKPIPQLRIDRKINEIEVFMKSLISDDPSIIQSRITDFLKNTTIPKEYFSNELLADIQYKNENDEKKLVEVIKPIFDSYEKTFDKGQRAQTAFDLVGIYELLYNEIERLSNIT